MLDPVLNFAKVAVSTGYDASATTIVLASGVGAKLPQPSTAGAFNLIWHNVSDYPDPSNDPNVEIVRVTARTDDTLTVVRAQEGTSAATHNTAGKSYQMILGITKKTIDDIDANKLDTMGTAAKATVLETARTISGKSFDGSANITIDRIVQLKIFDDATALATGDSKLIFCIPEELNGYNLTKAHAMVSTVSSSGAPTIQIRNVTDSVDVLSTLITIDATEFTSYTAATQPVIDTTKDDVATGDRIAIDVDGVGTGSKGLTILLTFGL